MLWQERERETYHDVHAFFVTPRCKSGGIGSWGGEDRLEAQEVVSNGNGKKGTINENI